MKIEIPDEIVTDLQRIDALQNCRVPFFTYVERGTQLQECERLVADTGDTVLSIVLREIRKGRNGLPLK